VPPDAAVGIPEAHVIELFFIIGVHSAHVRHELCQPLPPLWPAVVRVQALRDIAFEGEGVGHNRWLTMVKGFQYAFAWVHRAIS